MDRVLPAKKRYMTRTARGQLLANGALACFWLFVLWLILFGALTFKTATKLHWLQTLPEPMPTVLSMIFTIVIGLVALFGLVANCRKIWIALRR